MKTCERGYTLVELAIAVTILAVIVSAGMSAYLSWFRTQQFEQTVQNTETMTSAVATFKGNNNRFPCPAPFVSRSDPSYGYEGSCGTDLNVSPAGCAGGTCVAISQRTLAGLDLDNDGVIDPDQNPSIRIGMVPFRSLNIPEDFAYDRYGNVLNYAVTEIQARDFPHNPQTGGISIRDEQGNSLVQPPDSGDFLVYSTGADRNGGYGIGGNAQSSPCSASNLDGENCNNDSVFIEAAMNTGLGATHFDDILRYEIPAGAPLWARSPTNPDNIYNTRDGAIGSDYSYNFRTKDDKTALGEDTRLWVGGNMRIEGNVLSQGYCDQAGANCFPTRVIAGDGVNCNTGDHLMYGIEQSASRCSNNDNIIISCPGDKIVSAVPNSGSGVLGCSDPPYIPYTDPAPDITCPVPWGGTVPQGGSVQAYDGSSCTAETRTCQADGTLSGSNTNESRPASCDEQPPTTCTLPWGGTINDKAQVLAYNETDCEGLTRTCNGTVLEGNPDYNHENKAASCAPCVSRYRWVTSGVNGQWSPAQACAQFGATAIAAHYRGICASGEVRPTSGADYQKIEYKRGTWGGGGGRGGDQAPWQNNAYRCYQNGQGWDKDNTDVAIAFYCDFGPSFAESCPSDDPPPPPPTPPGGWGDPDIDQYLN